MSQPTFRLADSQHRDDPHVRALRVSTNLSVYYAEHLVTPLQVIAVLNREKISFVLVGAHAVGGWTKKPRATEDVDLVVAERQIKKATRALLAEFPHLEARDEEVVVRLQDRDSCDVLIGLIKPRSIYREIFKHTHAVSQGEQSYRIPSLEMALATKFAAMVSPNRHDDEKHQDATDFIRMVKQNADIDDDRLNSLGELVYGGGAKVCALVQKVRDGETLIL
jgi:hypothetical protein